MNQKEEIQKQEQRLATLESNLHFIEEELKTKYSDIETRLEQIGRDCNLLYLKKEKIKKKVAEVIAITPNSYVQGYHTDLKKDIEEFGNKLSIRYVLYGKKYQDVVWKKFNDVINENPESKKISELLDSLNKESNELKNKNPEYQKLKEEIHELRSTIKSVQSFIEQLNDIGYFRHHSKEMKRTKLEEEIRQDNEKKLDTFAEWFDKEYLPKMKQAIVDACKD